MQTFIALWRRDLASFLFSMTGWVLLATVLLLSGLSFTVVLEALNREPTQMPVTELFYQTQFFWLIVLMIVPVITMRTFALEKDLGTYETLMTTPIRDSQVVLAKFFACFAFYLLLWIPLLAYPFLIRHFSSKAVPLDPGTLVSTFTGIALFGTLYIAIGCFASSLTRSQVLAAMVAFALGLVLFLLSFLSFVLPSPGPRQTLLLSQISMVEHMRDFFRGVIDSRHVCFYLSLALFFLFLNLKTVESRRWR